MELYTEIKELLIIIGNYITLFIEIFALSIIVYALIKTIINMFRKHKFDANKINLDSELNHYLSISLEILLASELIKTITNYSINALIEVFVLIAIRIFISLILHLESKEKNKNNINNNIEK